MPRTPRNSPNPPGRPPKTAQVAEALRIVEKTGESIEEAAKRAGVNPDTVYAHKAKMAAPRVPGASLGPALPAGKLGELTALVGRLPLAQQDALVAALPLERLRVAAVARGLAEYPAAASSVARELRAVSL